MLTSLILMGLMVLIMAYKVYVTVDDNINLREEIDIFKSRSLESSEDLKLPGEQMDDLVVASKNLARDQASERSLCRALSRRVELLDKRILDRDQTIYELTVARDLALNELLRLDKVAADKKDIS